MAEDHWTPALQQLTDDSTGLYGPESFLDYLRDSGEDPRSYRTAAEISIDKKRDLGSTLREHDTMVLRLGRAPDGSGTQFALVRVADQLDDFFLVADSTESTARPEFDFSPGGADVDLLTQQAEDILDAYRLLPTFSESSLVDLALSTGVLSRALDLDTEQIGTAPTTIASTFDFTFVPHPKQPTPVHHNRGQVEVDAMIATRRNGRRVLVIVEAKAGDRRDLAKHKLFYPVLSVADDAQDVFDAIVPVYLRAQETDDGAQYDIYECSFGTDLDERPVLSELHVESYDGYRLRLGQ